MTRGTGLHSPGAALPYLNTAQTSPTTFRLFELGLSSKCAYTSGGFFVGLLTAFNQVSVGKVIGNRARSRPRDRQDIHPAFHTYLVDHLLPVNTDRLNWGITQVDPCAAS